MFEPCSIGECFELRKKHAANKQLLSIKHVLYLKLLEVTVSDAAEMEAER